MPARTAAHSVAGGPGARSAPPFATVQDLSVTYPTGVQAVDRVSFTLHDGEFVSLVGPSGCGKSTVLKVLAGLLSATAGSIHLDHAPGAPPSVGFVFQHRTLLGWRTVAHNVRLPLELGPQPPQATPSAVTDALAWVGLTDFADTFPGELSGGMQMRAAIARALVVRPRLLLMDEPFAALDDITRQRLNEDLVRMWQRDRWNALFVTHNVAEAVFLSQRILVLSPRPARIVADIPVAFALPRDQNLRTSTAFIATVAQVAQALSAH